MSGRLIVLCLQCLLALVPCGCCVHTHFKFPVASQFPLKLCSLVSPKPLVIWSSLPFQCHLSLFSTLSCSVTWALPKLLCLSGTLPFLHRINSYSSFKLQHSVLAFSYNKHPSAEFLKIIEDFFEKKNNHPDLRQQLVQKAFAETPLVVKGLVLPILLLISPSEL